MEETMDNGPVTDGQPESVVETTQELSTETVFDTSPSTDSSGTTEPSSEAEQTSLAWKALLDSDMQGDSTLTSLTDDEAGIQQMAKMLVHSQRLVGRDKIPLPGKNASAEEWQQVFAKLGKPDTSDGYEFETLSTTPSFLTPEDPEKKAEFEKANIESWKEIAHKANLTKEQAHTLYNELNTKNSELMSTWNDEVSSRIERDKLIVTEAYGEEGSEKYNQNKAIANRAFQSHFDAEAIERMTADGSIYSPDLQRLMLDLGKNMLEDNVDVSDPMGRVGSSGAAVQKRIDAIEGDAKGALYDRTHPQHKKVVEERDKLYQQLYS